MRPFGSLSEFGPGFYPWDICPTTRHSRRYSGNSQPFQVASPIPDRDNDRSRNVGTYGAQLRWGILLVSREAEDEGSIDRHMGHRGSAGWCDAGAGAGPDR